MKANLPESVCFKERIDDALGVVDLSRKCPATTCKFSCSMHGMHSMHIRSF